MGLILRIAVVVLALSAPASAFASTTHERLHGQLVNHAHEPLQPTCHGYSQTVMPLGQAITAVEWNCRPSGWRDGNTVSWLSFSGWTEGEPPLLLSSRITVFESLSIAAIADGAVQAVVHYSNDDARPRIAGPVFSLPMPATDAATDGFIVRIVRPHSVTIASEATVTSDPFDLAITPMSLILLAMVAGMLLMPLMLDAMFYVVLRERFVLLHAGMTMAMLAYVMFTGGVVHGFADVPVSLQAVLGPLVWAIGVGLGGLFTVAFLERDALPDWLRKTVIVIGWWTMLVPGFFALQLDATQPFDNQMYFLSIAAAIPTYLVAVVVALFSGSKAARYLIVAWMPIILASADRLLRGMGVYSAPASADQALYLAMALEVMIISLGVAERFLTVRRERDLALNQARSLGELSERDPLTDLLNRRAVVERFDSLRAAGFTTFALLDIDHFKTVNDTFGHGIGDNVLRAVARALQPDDDCIAVRMGGEEFLLLLRGRGAAQRAEQRRQAIVLHVANAAQLDRPVTASMGLVEAPAGALAEAGFEAIYRRADKLLYEAKEAGRNRTISERLQLFRRRHDTRRTVV